MLCTHHFYDYTQITKEMNNRRITGTYSHRIIKMGRDHRITLVYPPAQSKLIYNVRPEEVVQDFFSVRFWKLLRTEMVQPLWASCSSAWLPSWGEIFSLRLVWPTVSIYTLCVSCPLTVCCWEECDLSSLWPPHRYGEWLLYPLKPSLLSWINPGHWDPYICVRNLMRVCWGEEGMHLDALKTLWKPVKNCYYGLTL